MNCGRINNVSGKYLVVCSSLQIEASYESEPLVSQMLADQMGHVTHINNDHELLSHHNKDERNVYPYNCKINYIRFTTECHKPMIHVYAYKGSSESKV